MTMMEDAVLVIRVLAALTIIGMVMLQRGKGAEMGAGFGSGSSTTVFGASGSGNFLTKTTTIAAILFFLTSFSLAYFAKERSKAAVDPGIPTVEQVEAIQQNEIPLPVPVEDAVLTGESEETVVPPEGDPDLPTVD